MILAGGAAEPDGAQEEPDPAVSADQPRTADEAAIREASQALARAFEQGDAGAVAGFWTTEGEYLDEGGDPVLGREALEEAYAELFANGAELEVESKTDSIRFLGADTAVEEGTFIVRAKDAPANASRFSSLYVREGDKWWIALLKEWGDDATSRPSLEDLAWLIGTWESEGEGLNPDVACPSRRLNCAMALLLVGFGLAHAPTLQVQGHRRDRL